MRTILHCDMNSFYASVELLDRPDLSGRPVAVCGDPKSRHGIILAKNEEAKKFGVKTAETVWQARRKCPDLTFLPAHHDKYKEYYHIINEIYQRFTDQVEPFSIDESWLDVSASRSLFGDGVQIADRIRRTVREETGLTLSAGVSFNKFFAKMGSEYKKPDATTEITRENYRDLLWPLPVGEMFFVGAATAKKLKSVGIQTIGELAESDPALLQSLLGSLGLDLHRYANGLDDRPVALASAKREIKSVGHGMTFPRNLLGEDDIRTGVIGLTDRICARLRRHRLLAGGIKVEIKDPNFSVISRQKQLPRPSYYPEELIQGAMELIHASWDLKKPIRLLTITGINLRDEDEEEPEQLSLFGETSSSETDATREQKQETLEKVSSAVDHIREKFGDSAIAYGRVVGNDLGIRGTDSPKSSDGEHVDEGE